MAVSVCRRDTKRSGEMVRTSVADDQVTQWHYYVTTFSNLFTHPQTTKGGDAVSAAVKSFNSWPLQVQKRTKVLICPRYSVYF